ncbi:MAG TPA: glycosyltransferase family 4 protein [Terracidiphilus sp.]|nr:glycosyltransferase family 4 protein [Terracidiphilus sp.]
MAANAARGKMHIAVFNQFFWPDVIATGQYLTDVSRALSLDHDVTAICSGPAHGCPDSSPYPRIVIVRSRTIAFAHRAFARIASYLSYLSGSMWHGLRLRCPDVILTLTTPPILPVIGSLISTLRGARHVVWEMDVYPDVATDVGWFRKGSLIDCLSGVIIDWSRRRAFAIVVLGDDMKSRLIGRGIDSEKIHIVENWADGSGIVPHPFPDGPLVIHYSGNLGLAHEIETIKGAMGRLRNHKDFRFVFSGAGARRPALEGFCRSENIHNVEFRSYCERVDLGRSLSEAHLGLVTQRPETLGSVVPSKTYGIMAAGRPLLFIGPDASTPARHIQRFNCGWRIEPGDVDSLTKLLLSLNQDRSIIVEAGKLARAAFDAHFDSCVSIPRLTAVICGAGSRTVSRAGLRPAAGFRPAE